MHTRLHLLLGFTTVISLVSSQWDTHEWGNRNTIVHLFEWKWDDIADECERFLAPNGFGGVQLSPVTENLVVAGRPWWERYQPMSYNFVTRSGDEKQLASMIRRCNNVGVRIYVDLILNHMTAHVENAIGTGGSSADTGKLLYPSVPYGPNDFHSACTLSEYTNANQVRNCELSGLHDLDQSREWTRTKIAELLNRLVSLGVAGFRIDAAKHMNPEDLKNIYGAINDLNPDHGFPSGTKAFIYQEVIDLGNGHEAVSKYQFNQMGVVTEFKFGAELGKAFRGGNALKWLKNWGPEWGLLPSRDALVFIDNHDNQRGHGGGGADILTHKTSKLYKMATAFMLAHPYGHTRVMSSFAFDNTDQGPPQDLKENIISPSINADGTCGNGWICEHRWRQIYQMVDFRNVVAGTGINDWWDNGNNQIAFCRGGSGFIAINNELGKDLSQTFQTCLPVGSYCDVISGSRSGRGCSGKTVQVGPGGWALIIIKSSEEDGVLAIHAGEKINFKRDPFSNIVEYSQKIGLGKK